MSKVIERAVTKQLNECLTDHDLLPRDQSAYRKQHSTETAMLRVLSDSLTAADEQRVTLLGLLDLTAAFDCVDCSGCSATSIGLTGTALCWMSWLLTGRTQQVAYTTAPTRPVQFGVPKGSVLGPLLFVLYTAELSQVVTKHGIVLHQYADDCQVYVTTSPNDTSSAVDQFSRCLNDLQRWLSKSRLLLNPTKTQVLWLGPKCQVERVPICEVPVLDRPTAVKVVDTARSIGVIVNSHLIMSAHVTTICRAAYFQLRQIRLVA